jgi:hypothetical protein
MKRKRVIRILIISAVLMGVGCSTRQSIRDHQPELIDPFIEKPDEIPPENPDMSPDKKAENAEMPTGPAKPAPKTESFSQFSVTIDSPSIMDRILGRVDQNKLKKFEGSYTIDQLRSNEDPAYNVPIDSTWLPESLPLPQTRVLVKYNPVTGTYELVGGDLKLPAKDLSLSYEKDPSSEENQTYLIWKKEF